MAKTDVLSLAILGMLAEQPLHGYQIRKRLGSELGPFRALSYGSLYPALKRMVAAGLITASADYEARPGGSRRSRISYRLTEDGEQRLADELASAGASSWDDDAFDVRFSMFTKTDSATRLRILEGRRSRLAERLEEVNEGLQRVRERHDAYTTELHRHGLERVEREVEWLDRLIENERSATRGDNPSTASAGNN
ncbi:PadR family transcriptional regulator [uncultured Demequina sp.]|uniref:PadR family transcriptional regulator n=1 Tax=uncultured Demequina sp. TaxID=693499 RepID=UPI0025E3E6D8|nr:PadR family transcriptional regulator [uncultured Demequina sp.]